MGMAVCTFEAESLPEANERRSELRRQQQMAKPILIDSLRILVSLQYRGEAFVVLLALLEKTGHRGAVQEILDGLESWT
jgi:hypothetical protein